MRMVPALRITHTPTSAERQAALSLRHEVFVVGQGVPAELESDAADATAQHVVVLCAARAVATGRLRLDVGEPGVAKAERVAVAADQRRQGLGRVVMLQLERVAREAGQLHIKLAAQVAAVAFYESLGYEAFGASFMEAGIEHRWMRKCIRAL